MSFPPSLSRTMSKPKRPTTGRDLSEKQRAEFREAFDMFDLNKDNKISKDELGKVLETLGMNPTKQELKGRKKSRWHDFD